MPAGHGGSPVYTHLAISQFTVRYTRGLGDRAEQLQVSPHLTVSLLGFFLSLSLSLFFFWLHCKTCEILVLQAGIEQGLSARARNPNYWTIREVPWLRIFQALLLAVQGPLWGIQASSPLSHCVPRPLTTKTPAAPWCSHAYAPAGPRFCFPITWLTLNHLSDVS